MFWGNVYLWKSGFFIEVWMFAEKHCLSRGPPVPVPEPFASGIGGGVLKIKTLGAQESGL